MTFLSLPFASILLSKESGFNFHYTQVLISLDGIFNFILYNNVIYIIYHIVIFKWKWCESVILLYKSEKSSLGKFIPQNNTTTTPAFFWLPEF